MSGPVLHVEAAEIWAEGAVLLGPVSMTLNSPGITVIMGSNGAGKSLFLSMVHGLLKPRKGRVTWQGVAATETCATRGFVFQATPILRRSIAGNVAFPLQAQGIAKAKRAPMLAHALAEARLDADPKKPAAALSGGERRRLDLARAIVTNPSVILLDEPSANLDPATNAWLETTLRKLSLAGKKILLSTHDVAQARRLADDILFFDSGKMCEQASVSDFFSGPKHVAAQRFLSGAL